MSDTPNKEPGVQATHTPEPWIFSPADGIVDTADGVFVASVTPGILRHEFGVLIASAPTLAAKVERLTAALEAIRDYECAEVCKDDFAYDRLMENMSGAARAALTGDTSHE